MTSPARRHFLQATAAASAAVAKADEPQTSDAYQLMKAALIEDRRRLHDIQSIERKIEAKRTMLPVYQPYIDGVLQAGNGAQDDVLMTLMVWHLDTGDIASALPIAEYALKHNLNPGEQYQRSTAAILAEESSDTLLRAGLKPIWEGGDIKNPPSDAHSAQLEYMQAIEQLTHKHDMHDQVRAKLHKTIGYLHALKRDYTNSITALNRAVELDANCGVKKDIERIHPKVNNA